MRATILNNHMVQAMPHIELFSMINRAIAGPHNAHRPYGTRTVASLHFQNPRRHLGAQDILDSQRDNGYSQRNETAKRRASKAQGPRQYREVKSTKERLRGQGQEGPGGPTDAHVKGRRVDTTRQDTTSQDTTRQDKTRQDETRCNQPHCDR